MTNTTIQNRQARIENIVENFDFQTVTRVVEALNQQGHFDPQQGETLVDAITRKSVDLINTACNTYEDMGTNEMYVCQEGNLQVTIQSREDQHKVSLAYVVDTMETYNS